MKSKHHIEFTRRGFVKLSAAGAASAMVFGLSGCAPSKQEKIADTGASAAYTAGTYEAAAEGKGGPVKVQVAFSDSAIESIEVTDHGETRYVSDMALSDLPQAILDYQSLGIDTVTGATLSSMAVLNAVSDCVKQAGGDPDALRDAPGPEKKTGTEELDADLVIVGAGASGMAAAVAAAQEGFGNVVVLEKTSNMGGNALVSGGYLEYIFPDDSLKEDMTEGYAEHFKTIIERGRAEGVDEEFLATLQGEWDDYVASGDTKVFDSKNLYALDYALTTKGGGVEHWRQYVDYLVELDEWFDEMGFPWKKLCGIVGFPWPRWSTAADGHCGDGFFDLFSRVIDEQDLPITLIPLTPASELIIEDGKVAGVVGQCDDGTTYRVRSSHGVVLATGGFSGNPEMLKQYNTYWEWGADTTIPTTNAYGHTGDGLSMALTAGGFVAGLEAPMCFPYADVVDYSTETIVGDTGNCLLVNSEGKRFVDESLSRFDISKAIMDQPVQTAYIITGGNNCLINGELTQLGVSVQLLLDRKRLYKADTLEELAGLIGMDGATLAATVESYNAAAAANLDGEFGRTAFTETSALTEGPYYASPRTWAAHITSGGVVTDSQTFQAMTQEGAPIEGLYCVGELAAGVAGVGCMCTGMTAARQLAATLN